MTESFYPWVLWDSVFLYVPIFMQWQPVSIMSFPLLVIARECGLKNLSQRCCCISRQDIHEILCPALWMTRTVLPIVVDVEAKCLLWNGQRQYWTKGIHVGTAACPLSKHIHSSIESKGSLSTITWAEKGFRQCAIFSVHLFLKQTVA